MTENASIGEKKKTEDNPNSSAKIGLIISYPFQFYVYKNIYERIKNQAEFIIDLGTFYPIRQPDNLLETITKLLHKHNVFFRILHYEDYYYSLYQKKFFSRYDLLVSLWERGCLKLKCNISKKR